jgi:predicted transglutaminase-like cysteine proteinase
MTTGKRSIRRNTAFHALEMAMVAASAIMAVSLSSMPACAFLARPVIFSAIGRVTKPPSGWLQFCSENPEECRPAADAPRDVTLTPDLLQQLFTINSYANDRVKWTSDAELYGKSEHWAYPLDGGDCEDIVLLKRRLLARAGWPINALLITTVEVQGADPVRHAVLTVLTDRGELILDNQTPEILFWYETKYRYLARQSTADPYVWVSFNLQQPRPTVAAAH